MKFKSNTTAYYGDIFMHLFILGLWLVLLMLIPIRNTGDFEGYIFSLLALELLMFTCSPIAHRMVIIDDRCITEKWFFLVLNRIEVSKIAYVGVCTCLSGNQIRQFAFVSNDQLSDEEVIASDKISIFQRRNLKGRFITIEHPQKGLDECMREIVEKNHLRYRQFCV